MSAEIETVDDAPEPVRPGWIYAVHREDGSIAYVGQTIDFPAIRFRSHLADATRGSLTPFHKWLRHEVMLGRSPRVSTIERCFPGDLLARETFWIRHHHAEQAGATLNVAGVGPAITASPLTDQEVAELHVIMRRARELAEEASARESARKVRPVVDVVTDVLRVAPDAARVIDIMELADRELADLGRPDRTTEAGVVAIAEARGWAWRGDNRYAQCLIRLATRADTLTDPSKPMIDRVALFLAERDPGRGINPGTVCDATGADADEARAILTTLGWSKRPKRGEWDPPDPALAMWTTEKRA